MRIPTRAFAALAACSLPLAGLAAGPATAAPARAALQGSTLGWTANERAVGVASVRSHVSVRVYLAPRHQAALDAAVAAVTTPGSASYRHFITPAEYAERFAPAPEQVNAVDAWLRSAGLHVSAPAAGRRYVTATGTVDAAQRAFATTLRVYRHAGRLVTAPATDATVPAALAPSVLGVTGLDSLPHYERIAANGNPPPPAAVIRPRPCGQWYGQILATHKRDGSPLPKFHGKYRPYGTCGYLPQQFRSAYGADATGLTGAGTTVGITLWYASPTQPADINRFSREHGWPTFAPGQYSSVQVAPYRRAGQCGGAQDEQAIDITSVHDMAPAAKVVYYAAASCFDDDLIDTFARVVDDDSTSVINNSWGGPLSDATSGLIKAYEELFKQGALQGQSFFFSSGDDGDNTDSGMTDFDFPTSDPWVTSVGGTTLNIDSHNNRVWEAGWGYNVLPLEKGSWVPAGFGGGAGGGVAPAWGRPTYQHGVVHAVQDGRAYPDIAADSDNLTGVRVGYTQQFPSGTRYAETRWGGTSVGSPLMVGEQALAEQKAGGRIGFANPIIYRLARQGAPAYHDITDAHDGAALVRPDFVNGYNAADGVDYSIRTVDDDTSLRTHAGWDDVTGVGTPTANYPKLVAAAAAR